MFCSFINGHFISPLIFSVENSTNINISKYLLECLFVIVLARHIAWIAGYMVNCLSDF